MAKKDEKKAANEMKELREELLKIPSFRKFIVGLMVSGRYLKRDYNLPDYERGNRDAIRAIAHDFLFVTDGGKKLFDEFYEEMTNLHNSKKEY